MSSTADMSKVDGPAAMACRANLRSKKARSLFISGPATWALLAGDSSSHQDQNPRSTGSRTVAVIRRRRASSVSRAGMSARVTSPDPAGTEPSRVRQMLRHRSSVRGPQNAA